MSVVPLLAARSAAKIQVRVTDPQTITDRS